MIQQKAPNLLSTVCCMIVLAVSLASANLAVPSRGHAAGPSDPMVYLESMCISEVCNHTANLAEASFQKWVQDQIDAIKNPEHIEAAIGTCLDQLKSIGFVLGLTAGWPSLDTILSTIIDTVCDMVQQYWDQLLSQLIYQFQMPSVVNDILAMGEKYGFTTDITGGFKKGGGDCSKDIDGDGVKDCIPVGMVVISTPDGNQTYTTEAPDPVD